MTFFAFIFLQGTHKKKMLIGILFILVIAIAHLLQQLYATSYFGLLPWLRIPAVIVGLVSFYYMGQYFRGRAIDSVLVVLPLLLGLLVYLYQQTCLVNWTFVFQQWLNSQNASNATKILYQLAYQLIYVLPLLMMLILYRLIISIKFFSKFSKRLDVIGVLVILAISLLLILYPYALSNTALSLFIWVFLAIAGWILSHFYSPSVEREESN
jgi:hypothetical protein